MDRPSHVYVDSNSLWAFYNFVTIALQNSHPKTWMEDQRVLHYFISTVNNFQQCSAPAQIVASVPTDITADTPVVNPNQVDLEDLIAIAEAEQAVSETIVTYTDPVGNTFEAPVISEEDLASQLYGVDNNIEVVHNTTEDPEDEEEDLNDWVNLPVEELAKPEDFPGYEPAEDQEYTGENASYMKGSDFAIDKHDNNDDDFIFDIGDNVTNDDNDDDASNFF